VPQRVRTLVPAGVSDQSHRRRMSLEHRNNAQKTDSSKVARWRRRLGRS
jgi:hypothetical protein